MDINDLNPTADELNDGLAGDGGQPPETEEPKIEEPPAPTPPPSAEPVIEDHTGEDPMPQGGDINSMRAWIGRRDKRLRDDYDLKLQQTVDSLIQGLTPLIQQSQQKPVEPKPSVDINPDDIDFINDGVGSFKKLFNALAPQFATEYIPKFTNQQQAVLSEKAARVISGVTAMAKSDPVSKDDADRIVEIAKTLTIDNFDSIDAATATKLAYVQAQNIALRERMTKKTNPLDKNKPATQPIGTITPSTPANTAKPKVQLSSELADAASKMGLTVEQAMELLKED